jgi:arylsulfatase A-like enzyme
MRSLRRSLVPVLALAALALPILLPTPAPAQSNDDDLIRAACSVPEVYLRRTLLGWSPDRGAELSWIPKDPDFVGSGLPHVGPWDYIQHVPMFWYGPGYIPARGEVDRPVTLADIAPTQAALLDFDGFKAPDGRVMTEALDAAVGSEGYTPPRLIVVMVWDAAGINVLEEHEGLWPYTESLIDNGTWYTNAFVGSSPTSTAQDHATIGTGAFPIRHGLVGHHFKIGGRDATPWEIGPNYLVLPTLGDIYDQAKGNEPKVGIVATADIHLGMMSHGAFWNGGDRDVAITRSAASKRTLTDEGDAWNLPKEEAPYYTLAATANDVTGFEQDKEELDRADGKQDGKWRENDIEELVHGFDTPARTPYQQRVVERVLTDFDFGKDDVPDLAYVNFKQIDYVSHVWSMNSPEMGDSVKVQDDAMKAFVEYLDREVGEGRWAMVVTADHAAMPDPGVSGGYQISTGPIEVGIEATFDQDDDEVKVVSLVQPAQAFLNVAELEDNGYTVADVARYVAGLTRADTAGGGVTPAPGTEDEPAFQAVFPSDLLLHLPCLPDVDELIAGAV